MPTENDESEFPASLNRLAVVAFVAAGLVAIVALFALPTLRSMGLSFNQAFLVVGVVEFGSALVAGAAAMRFFTVRDDGGD
jgi:ABC-type transport system involved in cytochrome c biogenesis permease subunit